MMYDNDIASKFKATICILFVFGRMIVLIFRIWPNSQDPPFGKHYSVIVIVVVTITVLVVMFLCINCILVTCCTPRWSDIFHC